MRTLKPKGEGMILRGQEGIESLGSDELEKFLRTGLWAGMMTSEDRKLQGLWSAWPG